MSFTLPKLPYAYDALEPSIDARTMEIHHTKHHQAYIDKLNTLLTDVPEWQDKTIEDIVMNIDQVPESIRVGVRNNAGGHYNHSMFWEMLAPIGTMPSDTVKEMLEKTFGSIDQFKKKFADAGIARFGSGWVWFVKNAKGLEIISTSNQDNPRMTDPDIQILLGCDVWEHAYYLNYQNRRADYLAAFWNVVNWNEINRRFEMMS